MELQPYLSMGIPATVDILSTTIIRNIFSDYIGADSVLFYDDMARQLCVRNGTNLAVLENAFREYGVNVGNLMGGTTV